MTIASSVSKDDTPDTNVDVEACNNFIRTATVKSAQETKTDCENMTKSLAENWHTTPMAGRGREIQGQGLCTFSVDFRLYTLWVLFKRACVTSIWRKKQLIFIRMALHVVVVLILVALYNRPLGTDKGCLSAERPLNCSIYNQTYIESIPKHNGKFLFFSLLC